MNKTKPASSGNNAQTTGDNKNPVVVWEFVNDKWTANADAPDCPDPLYVKSPTDITKATAVLYPGQTRGNDYKAHGGLRFDGQSHDSITVRAPADMHLIEGSRYIEQGEVQYLLVFQNSCGLAFRFDHLFTLSPAMQKVADTMPPAKPDDSRTTRFDKPVTVKDGEVLATAVGFKNSQNVSFDFGVYDLRTLNLASKNASFAEARGDNKSQTFYGICWVNLLKGDDAKLALALPGGDSINGKNSDYC